MSSGLFSGIELKTLMRSELIVIFHVGLQDIPQLLLDC